MPSHRISPRLASPRLACLHRPPPPHSILPASDLYSSVCCLRANRTNTTKRKIQSYAHYLAMVTLNLDLAFLSPAPPTSCERAALVESTYLSYHAPYRTPQT